MATLKRVGVALQKEKAEKHISAKLIERAAEAGIELKLIDPARPFREQEPFDVLLHKIRDAEWHARLLAYQRKERPDLRIVDSFEAVQQLSNRVSMLDPVREGITLLAPSSEEQRRRPREACDRRIWQRADTIGERRPSVHVAVPSQVPLHEGTTPAEAREAAGNAGFQPPFLGKPLYADGREGSHGLLVIRSAAGLEQLAGGPRPATPGLPVVLQQYVPHGACLFKVYVLGPITVLVKRPSLRLPLAAGDLLEEVGDIQSVGRVSAYHSESEFGAAPQWDPPHWAIQALAAELRRRYRLSLFNFDLIQADRSQQQQQQQQNGQAPAASPDFLLIDANYFPGYPKLPDYEELFVLFLQSLFADADQPGGELCRFVAHSHVLSPRDLTDLP